jgi:hypothetical protein
VNVLSRLAELLRDGAHETTSSDRAGLPEKHHTIAFLRPSLWDKTRDKTPFVPPPRMAEILEFLEEQENREMDSNFLFRCVRRS